jgi:hypothetical protein
MNLKEEIARMAYELYDKSGGIGGRDYENWLEAERIVLIRRASQDIEEPEGEEPMIADDIMSAEVEDKGRVYATQEMEEEAMVIEEIDVREAVFTTDKDIVLRTEKLKPTKTVTDKGREASR